MKKLLPASFFNRPTLAAARDLLGKFIVRRLGRKIVAVMITEVEAYDGPRDTASHAHRGKTKRNEIMFGTGGRWYVYFVYGMHWMLNIVTGPKNYPAAVLIRGGMVFEGRTWSVEGGKKVKKVLNGPGKLTKFIKINKKVNGCTANKKTGLWIEDRGVRIKKSGISARKRIGVDYAGAWAEKPYRFTLKTN